MRKADTPEPENLWKNQRLIDEHGLVVCEDRQRLFDNLQAATLFEGLLKTYQEKGLGLHYLYIGMSDQDRKLRNFQTVKYRAYVRFRCIHKQFDGGRKLIGQFHVQYELVRLQGELAKHFKYPLALLFRPHSAERECEQCGDMHSYKVFQSSLYVIRSQFISMIRSKVFFMERYPAYRFTPFDFTQKRNSGDVVYEFIRDHNYQPSFYFEKSEEVLCNALRMQALLRGMDYEVIRLDNYKQWAGQAEARACEQRMERFRTIYKLKYMCRKCNPKQIWTTKNECIQRIAVVKLKDLPESKEKVVLDDNDDLKQEMDLKYCGLKPVNYGQHLKKLVDVKNTEVFNRRFDRSLKKEMEDYEDYGERLNSISRWHRTLQEYSCPLLVVISLDIPKMKCQVCQKEKEGLIYITNLLDELYTYLVRVVLERIERARDNREK